MQIGNDGSSDRGRSDDALMAVVGSPPAFAPPHPSSPRPSTLRGGTAVTDVLAIAQERHTRVLDEVESLDWFIRYGERLLQGASDAGATLSDAMEPGGSQVTDEVRAGNENVVWLDAASGRVGRAW
jgi:hypothetical protein